MSVERSESGSEVFPIRCPGSYKRMFGRLVRRDEEVTISDNLLQFSCYECTREARRFNRKVHHPT